MFRKLVVLTLALVMVGTSLLLLRQHRLELAHEAAVIHRDIHQTRQAIWDVQAEASGELTPRALARRIDAADLALEPRVPDSPVLPAVLAGSPQESP